MGRDLVEKGLDLVVVGENSTAEPVQREWTRFVVG